MATGEPPTAPTPSEPNRNAAGPTVALARQTSASAAGRLQLAGFGSRARRQMCSDCERSLPKKIVYDKVSARPALVQCTSAPTSPSTNQMDKIESIVKRMQDGQTGLPVKTAKSFMSKIPSVFTGSDLVQWMMRNLNLEDQQEAIHLANLIASHGYIFPIEDHNLSIKNDCTFYRFQTPCLWPSRNSEPENTDYAVYLCKRTMQGKSRLELADYEAENLARLQKIFSRKWDLIYMQAESQAKVDKKRDKLERKVLDSQERAFWDVHRPLPGCVNTTEQDIKKACRLSKSANRCSDCQNIAVDHNGGVAVTAPSAQIDATTTKTSQVIEATERVSPKSPPAAQILGDKRPAGQCTEASQSSCSERDNAEIECGKPPDQPMLEQDKSAAHLQPMSGPRKATKSASGCHAAPGVSSRGYEHAHRHHHHPHQHHYHRHHHHQCPHHRQQATKSAVGLSSILKKHPVGASESFSQSLNSVQTSNCHETSAGESRVAESAGLSTGERPASACSAPIDTLVRPSGSRRSLSSHLEPTAGQIGPKSSGLLNADRLSEETPTTLSRIESQVDEAQSICAPRSSSVAGFTSISSTDQRNIGELERELEALKFHLDRRIGCVKMSKVTQSYLSYFTQWAEYDPFVSQPIPSNPWISDSAELWDSERQTKDVHYRRVKRWAFSLKELLNDPAGREQFHRFLEKEFSAENLKFWDAVQELKRVHSRDVTKRVEAIWVEYLSNDANCPINIDSKSYESSKKNMAMNKNNRYIFDEAAGHVYQLMKNDSYPRYLRSDMYKDYRETSERKRTNQVAFDAFKPQITTLKHKFNF